MTDDIAVPRDRHEDMVGSDPHLPLDAPPSELRVDHFEPDPQTVAAARHFVVDALRSWGCEHLADDAAICVSELAANAVLHSRGPYDVAVHLIEAGIGVEVIDRRPAELPALVPTSGTAADITRRAATGRGLQIVSTLASRWGFTTSEADKAVWVELTADGGGVVRAPIAVLGHHVELPPDHLTLELCSLPVRTSVASGLQVEDLVRSLQLAVAGVDCDPAQVQRLHELLDASASVRHAGRHAALRAAGLGQVRYDLTLRTSFAALEAVEELARLLEELARRPIRLEVTALRQWLQDETRRQVHGEPPTPCPLG